MEQILLIAEVVLAVIIVIFVMLQKSSSMGLGAYSGSNESMFGAKGPTNFLTKGTMVLGLLFVVNTVTLGYIYNQSANNSVLDARALPAIPAADAVNAVSDGQIPASEEAPIAPSAPALPGQ